MISRRETVFGLASLMLPATAKAADLARTASTADLRSNACIQDFDTTAVVPFGATKLPDNAPEWAEARAIMNAAPRDNPYRVARYLAVRRWPRHPTFPDEQPYNEQWRTQFANPVIYNMFAGLDQEAEGDTVAWCSAFANWCLRRCGIAGTGSTAAQSFERKNWGRVVWKNGDGNLRGKARTGDVAVFQRRSDPNQGHVGFVVSIPSGEGSVRTLGGNQVLNDTAAMNVKDVDIQCKFKLLSIRRKW